MKATHICMLRTIRYTFSKTQQYQRKMVYQTLDFTAPVDRNMTKLNRDFFHKKFDIVKAKFTDPRDIAKFTRKFPEDVMNIPGIRSIIKDEPRTAKAVLMTGRLRSRDEADHVLSKGALHYLRGNEIKLAPYTLEVDYKYWGVNDILRAILPEHLLEYIPAGFTQTGHIAHLNLKDEFKPYRYLIGEVVLDKNPSITTVVDKIGTINSVYRTFDMEVVAGEHNFITEHKESNCTFRFDFSKVYWNSRLHHEHESLCASFVPGEVVFDAMAGVGPFAVPAGKKRVTVFANDLNPDSYEYLCQNTKINGATRSVYPYNMDGHDFIRDSYSYLKKFNEENDNKILFPILDKKRKNRPVLDQEGKPAFETMNVPGFIHHFVMNLPDSAISFLGDYNGIYHGHEEIKSLPGFKLPVVHVYCFEKFISDGPEPTEQELEKRILKRIQTELQYDLEYEDVYFKVVRKVAPSKPMYRASFTLPEAVAFGPKLEKN